MKLSRKKSKYIFSTIIEIVEIEEEYNSVLVRKGEFFPDFTEPDSRNGIQLPLDISFVKLANVRDGEGSV